jgi:S1-C subfamily serine protease
MKCVITSRSSSGPVNGFSCRLGVRTISKGRVAVPVIVTAVAVLFLGLGSYLGAHPSVDPQQELAGLRAEIDLLRKQQELAPIRTDGIAPPHPVVETPVFDDGRRAAIVADVKRQLQTEMGLLPLALIRDRRHSFVELYSYDDTGARSYGTAGYLGNGYFITVKHGVVALGQDGASDPRVINSIELMINGRPISARVIDAGDARVEVDPGDWAILKVNENIELPALSVGLNYQFEFADPIFRLGNDYSKGIVVSTGYVGQRTPNKLVTSLTDGHPGVSGGGVLNAEGRLVGIPVGRMDGDFRFSFILPLRDEMFQKVKVGPAATPVVPSRSARIETADRRW